MTVAAREKIPPPSADDIELATVMRTVGDPLRLAIVRTLAERGELHCGELQEAFGIPASTGSYHLRLLREAGVTRTRAEGTQRFISVRREDLERRVPGLLDVLTRA
jgi:DNA-binding transcriptional ArsR family regulator